MTGGLSLPFVLAPYAFGIVAAGVKSYTSTNSTKKLKEHITKLEDVLKEDLKEHKKFKDELSGLSDKGFDFELELKNGIRKYPGKGKDSFRRLTEKVIPSLEDITIQDESAKHYFRNIVVSVNKTLQEELYLLTEQSHIKKSVAESGLKFGAQKGAEAMTKEAVETVAEAGVKIFVEKGNQIISEKVFETSASVILEEVAEKGVKIMVKEGGQLLAEEVIEAGASVIIEKTFKSGTTVFLRRGGKIIAEEVLEAGGNMAVERIAGAGTSVLVETGGTMVVEEVFEAGGQFVVNGSKKGVEAVNTLGPLVGIVLGSLFLFKDGVQLYNDYHKESIAKSFTKMSDDVSRLPPEKIDY
jgi:hypothetical protein